MQKENYFNCSDFLHTDADQLKRQKAALKLNVQEIHSDNQTGKINDYSVSLLECSCRDFTMRRKPCKHMYRLAHELGLFHLSGATINDASIKNHNFKKNREIHIIEVISQLCDEDKYTLYKVMYEYLYRGKIPTAINKSTLPEKLINEQLLSIVSCNMEALEKASKMDELKLFIRLHNCDIKLRKKSDILKKLLSDYPDLFQFYVAGFEFVVPSSDVLNSPRKIYSLVLPAQKEY